MSSQQSYLKLVLLGHKNVGKTSLFNRYLYDEFIKTSMTIGAYFGMKACTVGAATYNLAIWDTAGEEKFDSLTSFYCRKARAALVVYDMSSLESFNSLPRWVEKVRNEAAPNCTIVIVGNKADLVADRPAARQVDAAEARRYAQSIGALLFEASAKTGAGVAEAFQRVVELAIQEDPELGPGRQSVLDAPKQQEDKGCPC
jgi:small GTP-binding protein